MRSSIYFLATLILGFVLVGKRRGRDLNPRSHKENGISNPAPYQAGPPRLKINELDVVFKFMVVTRLKMGRIDYKGGIPPYSTLQPYKH